MKVSELNKYYPNAILAIQGLDGSAYPVKSFKSEEGVYSLDDDSYKLLSENNLTDLENEYGKNGEGLDFVSLLVIEA